jgi:hypothetical protein
MGGQHRVMAPRQSGPRRTQPDEHALHDGQHDDRHHDHDGHGVNQAGPGVDLPVFGHVEYKSVGFMTGLGIAGAVGVIEWPVAAAVGIGYALTRRK